MPTPARFAALPVALSLRCASIDPLWQRLSRYRWHFPCNRSWHATDAAVMSKWVLGAADRATWRVVWSATLCGSQLRLRPSCLPPRADVRAMARIQHSLRCWHANLCARAGIVHGTADFTIATNTAVLVLALSTIAAIATNASLACQPRRSNGCLHRRRPHRRRLGHHHRRRCPPPPSPSHSTSP